MVDVSVIIENEDLSEISAFKKKVLQESQTETNVEAKTVRQDEEQNEDEASIDALQNLYIVDGNIDSN